MSNNVSRFDVVEHTLEAYTAELVRLARDGWKVSPTCPGDVVGHNTYTVSMYRDDDAVEEFRQLSVNIAEKPKLSRQEAAEKARAVLSASRAAKAGAKLDVNAIVA